MDEIIRKKPGPKPRVGITEAPLSDSGFTPRRYLDEQRIDTMRDDLRGDLRASDPQEAARIRAQEVFAQLGDSLGDVDEFFVPEEMKQPGWDYEWKRFSTINQEDPHNINKAKRTGWQEVPAKTPGFERFLPRTWKESFILKEGMLLMMRPTEVTAEINRRHHAQAVEKIRTAEAQNGQAPPGTLPRDNSGNKIHVHGVSGAKRTIVGAIPN
jgi:hypothetical protein